MYTVVVVKRGSNIPPFNSVITPRVALFGFLCIRTFGPAGTSGVLLKSKFPNRYAYAERFGLSRHGHRRFKVSSACGRS